MGWIASIFKSIAEALSLPRVWVPIVALVSVVLLSSGVFLARGAPAWGDIQSWTFAIIIALVIVLVVVVVLLLRYVFNEEHTNRLDSGFRTDSDSGVHAAGATGAGEAVSGISDPLEAAFLSGVEKMRRAPLGSKAYLQLPWVLIVGEGGSGKSLLIRESGLSLPADQADLVPRDGRTEHLNWWLTNEAVVLDTSGRFLDDDSKETRESWRALMKMIFKRRRARGLQSLVITVAADQLLGSTSSELRDRGERMRRRINELTVELCLDLPVYLVITKADHIEGFTALTQHMSDHHAREVFGWTNAERRFTRAGPLIRNGLTDLLGRLKARLPVTLLRPSDNASRRQIFFVAEELDECAAAAATLAEVAFAPSEYEDVKVPFLRGVYFTSATQGGDTVAPYLERLGLAARRSTKSVNVPHPKPLFLHDLFRSVILPSSPLAWRTSDLGPRSRAWASGAAAALSIGLIGYWGVAAYQQITRIGEIRAAAETLEVDGSITALDRLRQEIGDPSALTEEEIKQGHAEAVLPGFGLGWALDSARDRARTRFVEEFRPLREQEIETHLDDVARTNKELGFGALATVVRERRFLESRDADDAPRVFEYSKGSGSAEAFESAYTAYALWLSDEERAALLTSDEGFIKRYSLDFQRLSSMEDWSDKNRDQIPPIGYAPIVKAEDHFQVTGIYTATGYKNFVMPYFDAVEGILEERKRRKEDVSLEEQEFENLRKNYIDSYFASWTRYLNEAPTGTRHGKPLRDVLSSPHLDLLARIDRNTRPNLLASQRVPDWIQKFHSLRKNPPAAGTSYCAGLRPRDELADDDSPAPWEAYCNALRKFGDVVDRSHSAPLAQAGIEALQISRALPAGPPEYVDAVAAAQTVTKIEDNRGCGDRARCESAPASLLALFLMPIGDGVSDILDGAVTVLDQRWKDVTRDYPPGRFRSHQIKSFYEAGGTLDSFLTKDLEGFYRNGIWLSPVDRALPIGQGFRDWLVRAERLKRNLFGQTYRPIISTHGIDPVREDDPRLSEGWAPTTATLRVRCKSGEETEVNLLRNRQWKLPQWSTDCDSVSIYIEVGQDRTQGMPVSPAWEINDDPYAVPHLLSQIRNGGITKSFKDPRVTLRARISIDAGGEIRGFGQHPLTSSLRN